MNALPFRSTWFHHWFSYGFMLYCHLCLLISYHSLAFWLFLLFDCLVSIFFTYITLKLMFQQGVHIVWSSVSLVVIIVYECWNGCVGNLSIKHKHTFCEEIYLHICINYSVASSNSFDHDLGFFQFSGIPVVVSTGNARVLFNTTMVLDTVGHIQLFDTMITLNSKRSKWP